MLPSKLVLAVAASVHYCGPCTTVQPICFINFLLSIPSTLSANALFSSLFWPAVRVCSLSVFTNDYVHSVLPSCCTGDYNKELQCFRLFKCSPEINTLLCC